MPATSPEAIARRRETLRLKARAKRAAARLAKGSAPIAPKRAGASKAGRPPGAKNKNPRHPITVQPSPRPPMEKLKAFKDQKAIVPAHVTVQKLPSPPLDRWNVSIPVGGFVSEWLTKRGQAA